MRSGRTYRSERAESGHQAIEVCTLAGTTRHSACSMAKQSVLLALVATFVILAPPLLQADGVIVRMTGPDGRSKTFNPSHPPRRGEEPVINKLMNYREAAEECRKAAEVIRLETDTHNPYETPNYEVYISEAFGFCRLDYYAIVMQPWQCSADDIGSCLRYRVEDEFALALPYGPATDSRLIPGRPSDAPLQIYFDITNLDSAVRFAISDKDCRVVFGGIARPNISAKSISIFGGNITLSAPCFVA